MGTHGTAPSLQDSCIDCIAEHLPKLCKPHPTEPTKLVFKDSDMHLPDALSNRLLAALINRGDLNDGTLSLFHSLCTSLTTVNIDYAKLTTRGLSVLKTHRISRLALRFADRYLTFDDLSAHCLGDWTLENLRSLTLCFTNLDNRDLDSISKSLPHLETLDISDNKISHISPLRDCKNRLRSLTMRNLDELKEEGTTVTLWELSLLELLDVSLVNDATFPLRDIDLSTGGKFQAASLIERTTANPKLRSLDISGRGQVTEDVLR